MEVCECLPDQSVEIFQSKYLKVIRNIRIGKLIERNIFKFKYKISNVT